MKLNLGCADIKKEDWLNVDLDPLTKPDLIADALNLPYLENSVDEIYAGHLVEHLTPLQATAAVQHWHTLLKPGGKLCIVTPDFKVLAEQYLAGAIPLEEMTDIYIFSYVQPSHHQMLLDTELQIKLLMGAGFHDVRPINRHTDHRLAYGVDWQCGCEGRK